MTTVALLAIFAMLLSLSLTPACRSLCSRFGWVDYPDLRKLHQRPIPRTGGIAIFLSYAAVIGFLLLYPARQGHLGGAPLSGMWALVPAILVAFATGLLDDLAGLSPWMKI